jgi:pyroglutamyl-peptidase
MAPHPNQLNDHAHRTLVTGFDPFGGRSNNPSADLVALLEGELDDKINVGILPTSYQRGWDAMRNLIRQVRPSSVLMFGFSSRVEGLRLERDARNRDYSRKLDNDGRTGAETIVSNGPASLRALADVNRLVEQLTHEGVPAIASESASGYVCNHVYYRTLMAADGEGISHCLVVHVGDWSLSSEREKICQGAGTLVTELARI